VPKVVDHAARRKDFIAAAYATIVEQGLDNTTVRGVAQKAGYTTGALVHYFKDKEELIKAALNYFGDELRARIDDANSNQRGRKALRATLMEAIPTNKESASSWRIWLALWYHSESDAEMRLEQRARYGEWFGRIQKMLSESCSDGELGAEFEVELEARSLVAFIDGLGVQYLMSPGRLRKQRIAAMVDGYLDRLYDAPGCGSD
jgi:AcrR family transcriptional regulator